VSPEARTLLLAVYHGLHMYVGQLRDAYNHGQGHGITPIHAM